MSWDLYLFETEQDYEKDKCFLSPAASECPERLICPRIGEKINYIDNNMIYTSRIVEITHSYTHTGIDIDAVIIERHKA